MENINSSHLEKLEWLDTKLDDLVSSRRVLERYNFWWKDFTTFTEKREVESWRNISNSEFQMLLSDFLFSNTGSKYQKNFHFETELECGSQAPDILVIKINFLSLIKYFVPGDKFGDWVFCIWWSKRACSWQDWAWLHSPPLSASRSFQFQQDLPRLGDWHHHRSVQILLKFFYKI